MPNWIVIVVLVLSSKYTSSANSSRIPEQCIEGSNTGTPRQEAKCICELTNDRINGCNDVAITNMTWTGSESISCEQETPTNPEFVLRCFDNRFEIEVV